MTKDHILVITSIPLLDYNGLMEVFMVQNIIMPYCSKDEARAIDRSTLTAKYNLESNSIALNRQRTKYLLLNDQEISQCSNPSIGFCHVRSPVYPTNLSKMCVITLFMKNDRNVEKFCQLTVFPNSILPQANLLHDGVWIVSSDISFTFAVACHGDNTKDDFPAEIKVTPPVGIISLNMPWTASADYLTLLPYFQGSSKYTVKDKSLARLHSHLNLTNLNLWKPLKSEFGMNFTPVKLAPRLMDIPSMPISDLIRQVKSLDSVVVYQPPIGKYIIGGVCTLVILVVIGYIQGV